MRRVDAIVVGAGVMGASAARALAERGRETVLFEQFELGHARGSSHGPTRLFRLAYPQPDYVRLAQRAVPSWRRLEEQAAEPLLVTTGGLYAGEWAERCGAGLGAAGVRHAWLSAREAAERVPAMSFAGLERVLWQEAGGVCLADRTVAALVRVGRAHGLEVREGEAVEHAAARDDGAVVTSASGQLRAPVVVVAAGTWAGSFLARLGMEVALRPAFTQVSYFAPRRGEMPEALPAYIEGETVGGLGAGGYWVPPLAGATVIKAGAGVPGRTVDPNLGPFPPEAERERRDAEFVVRRLPGLDPAPLRTETCLYTMAPDEDFVLTRAGQVVVCSCCSGHGFKFGPLLGEIAADLATGADPGIPAERFALKPAPAG